MKKFYKLSFSLILIVLIMSTISCAAPTEKLYDFDDALILKTNISSKQLAKDLEIVDQEGSKILYLENYPDEHSLAIAPLAKMGKVKIKANHNFTVEPYNKNFYLDNQENVKRLTKFLQLDRPAPIYMTDAVMESAVEPTKGPTAKKSAEKNYSETNVQEKGIDEGDIVKTDGKYIYYSRNSKIDIVKADKQNSTLVSSINLPNNNQTDLIIYKDKLVAIGNLNRNDKYYSDETEISVYDIKDKKNPKLSYTKKVKGYYNEIRLIDNILYVNTIYYIPVEYKVGYENGRKAYLKTNGIDLKKLIFIPGQATQTINTITSVNLDNTKDNASENILANSESLYMSKNAIYITVSQYSYYAMYNGNLNEDERSTSIIRKFDIDKTKIKYKAQGKINGTVLNQFSMGEKDGHFIVCHNTDEDNQVTVFDNNMKKVASIEKIAQGERIYSARFDKDKLYLVTFKQVDPLFTIDISDVKNPKIMGYLKIPGYSEFLQPFKENYLIGFGRSTKEIYGGDAVRSDKFKLSLFDIKDFKNPKEIQSIELGNPYSQINFSHKALLIYEPKDLIGISAVINEINKDKNSMSNMKQTFNGAIIYKLNSKGIHEEVKITQIPKEELKDDEDLYNRYYNANIQRIIYIDNCIYTLSSDNVFCTDLSNKKDIAKIKLSTIKEKPIQYRKY